MTPKQKKERRDKISSLKSELARLNESISKFPVGKIIHQKLKDGIASVESELRELTKHPNAI